MTPAIRPTPPRGFPSFKAALLAALAAGLPIAACSDPSTPDEVRPCDGPISGVLCLRPIVGDLDPLVHVTFPVGDERLFLLEQTGRVLVLEADTLRREPFLDLSPDVTVSEEEGLLGLAFDPGYRTKRVFYVYYVDRAGDTRLSRIRVSADPNRADRSSEETLLVIPREIPFHHAGHILFGPDGYLWVTVGDGARADLAQDLGSVRGSILRLDVSGDGPYAIPPDNPFIHEPGARPEIWMYGLRNPWRIHLDEEDQLLYIADVGATRREELNILRWNTPGANFGWPILEGSECFQAACSADGTVLPALDYGHDEGCAIVGGHVVRGSELPGLRSHYVYGDHCGFIRSLRYEGGAITQKREWWKMGELGRINSFGTGPEGDLYLLLWEGRLLRIEPAP